MPVVALHRAQFDIGSGVEIEIECTTGQGRLLASPPAFVGVLSAEEEVDYQQLSQELPPMCWRETGELFEVFQLREDTDYFVDVVVPLPLTEASRRAEIHRGWPFSPRLAGAFTREPSKRWREVRRAGGVATVVTGQLRLRSHAGILDLSTELGGRLRAEVVCRKLGYFAEFKALLDALAEKATELLLAYDTPVSISFGLSREQTHNDAALYFLMRYVMSPEQLPAATAEVLSSPHTMLSERLEMELVEQVDEGQADLIIDHLDISSLAKDGPLARFFRGHTPRELPRRDTSISYDTAENRYAKALLEHCRLLAARLEDRMQMRGRNAAQREARSWGLLLDELLQHSLWREVGPLRHIPANSQSMLRRRGYKEFFRLDAALRLSLALAWSQGADLADGLIGDIRPVNQIYEYWCFFALRDALRSLCAEKAGGDFVVLAADGLRLQLAKGRKSECRFEFTSQDKSILQVSLFYNRKFLRARSPQTDWSGSYTAAFDPDYSIVVRAGDGRAHWLHFDAKYRLERQQAEAMFEGDEDGSAAHDGPVDYEAELVRVHKQDDLFKMHTYRDGILSTRGAYVLFPGDGVGGRTASPNSNFFVRHPSALGGAPSQLMPSVGAFPLTPQQSGRQLEAIRDLLRSALEQVGSGATYEEERGWFGPTT